jgi:hypothetical protein
MSKSIAKNSKGPSRSLSARSLSTKSSSSHGDGALFRPEPHFVSKQEMRSWRSVLQVFTVVRQPLIASEALNTDACIHHPRLIESLGLKYPNPEKFFRTIYVQPLLTFHVKIGPGVGLLSVPDWLDWDPKPNSFFYDHLPPARQALPKPLNFSNPSKVRIGGMVHELQGGYFQKFTRTAL